MFSRRWWWTTLLVLLAVGVTIRLGVWQLDRLAARRADNAHVREMQAAPVLVLSGRIDEDLAAMEYRAVEAAGMYDFEHQVAIRNQVWTQRWGDEPGHALLTPLVLADGAAILVRRGWIPARYDTPESWREFDEPGRVTVTGVLRRPLEAGEMGGGVPDPTLAPGQAGLSFWNFVNVARLQKQIPHSLAQVYIQEVPGGEDTRLPYAEAPVLDLSDGTHLGWAAQWFFFAALLLAGYPVWLRRQTALESRGEGRGD